MPRFLLRVVIACLPALLLAPAAQAIEVREAVRLCDANPNCSYGDPDAGGGMLLVVQGEDGTVVIDCPPRGDCTIPRRANPFAAVTGHRGVVTVLSPSAGPTPTGPTLVPMQRATGQILSRSQP